VPSHREIPRILGDEVTRARMAYQSAHAELNAIAADIQSAPSSPNGVLRIRNAGADYRSAMEEYDRAVNEFNAFLKGGVVPDRLKEDNDKGLAANA
jgi:hypothetical protein